MISEECLLSFRCTRNTAIYTSTINFGGSGRVDGPLLETHSLLRPEGGSGGKKCPIMIFQYVIELEKNEQDAKNGRLI